METLNMIYQSFKQYFADGGYGVMFAAALMYLAWRKRNRQTDKARREMRLLTVSVIMILVTACPLTAKIIMFAIGDTVYWRVYWMLPVMSVIAYAVTELIGAAGEPSGDAAGADGIAADGQSAGTADTAAAAAGQSAGAADDAAAGTRAKRHAGRRKALTGLICAALIALNGTFVFSNTYFTNRENNYKLPTQIIRVADAISTHAKENRIWRKRTVAPGRVTELIRVYDASIQLMYGRYHMMHPDSQTGLFRQINRDDPNHGLLAALAQKRKCRYVVLNQDSDDRETMEKNGYEVIMDEAGYVVYFDTHFYKKNKKN